jgi:hypothetical protein
MPELIAFLAVAINFVTLSAEDANFTQQASIKLDKEDFFPRFLISLLCKSVNPAPN